MNNDTPKTVEIQLTKGYVCIVDSEDADLACERWHAAEMPAGVYAQRNGVGMHRKILERKLGRPMLKGYHCDHINHDTLDNRRENLREVTRSQNAKNSKPNDARIGGYTGVYRLGTSNKWRAIIRFRTRRYNLGVFDSPEDAHAAYLVAKVRITTTGIL